ncbi:MAG: TRIC cation channel family protein, partial [Prevotella sp.]|nr:TRIC cation channel family protein [Prevotella sp.]
LFTIAGIQKSLLFDQPYWVAIIMGCITGSAGGVIRDVLLNNEPVIFQREIYAMASVLGGITYWALDYMGVPVEVTVMVSFLLMCLIRFLAVRYHLSLPRLKSEQADMDE